MLTIRFQRVGRKNDPAFRIVLTEKRSKPKSGELETLGSFHPKTKEALFKSERVLYWLSKGAKASPRVHNLLVAKGVITGKKINVAKTTGARKPTVPSGAGAEEASTEAAGKASEAVSPASESGITPDTIDAPVAA